MRSAGVIAVSFLLATSAAAGVAAEPRSADPLAAFLGQVAAAVQRDDLAAFEPLVTTDFNWDTTSIIRLVTNYKCPEVRRWSFTTLERSDAAARVRLDLEGSAERAGRGTPAPLPRFWILELRSVNGRWRIGAFLTLERDIAWRILRARPEERAAIFTADPDADAHALVRDLADLSSEELDAEVKRRYGASSPADVVIAETRALQQFAVDEARRIGNASDESLVLSLGAASLRFHGLRAEALSRAEEAVDLAYLSGSSDALASALISRGLGRWVNGDAGSAKEDLIAAGRLVHDVNDVMPPLHSLAMMVHLELSERNYGRTIQLADQLKASSRDVGWEEGEAFATYALGDLHFELRDFSVAWELYHRAHDIASRVHAGWGVNSWVDMARADLALGNVARAEREIRGYPSIDTAAAGAANLTTLAAILTSARKFAEAERILTLAVDIGRKEDDTSAGSDALAAFAELRLAQHRPAAALDAAREALSLGLGSRSPLHDWSPWRAEAVTAHALRALGRNREARATIEKAIELVEQLRTVAVSDPSASRYFEDKVGLYDDLMQNDLSLGDVHRALGAIERLRARTLRDSLSQTTIDRSASLTPEEKAREEAAEKAVEAVNRKILAAGAAPALLRTELDHCRHALDQVTDELMAKHPELHVRRADFEPALSLPDSLASTAVVEYAVTAKATYLFTVVRKGRETAIAVHRTSITRGELTKLVGRLNRQIAQRDIRYRTAASRLYELLIAPAEGEILSRKMLCIVPDGPLWRLPFQVLTDGNGVDLITKRPIFHAPALSLLTASVPKPSTTNTHMLVAFGNPVAGSSAVTQMRGLFRGTGFGALPDAETEVRRIASIYGAARSEVFVGRDARESTFKREARTARIVHVATHGVIDDQAPLYSALLFAPDGAGGDDGLLEAREVLDLHLDADLVVLSACNTARGNAGSGEGVIGLSWAFLVAGCRTLVVAQSPAESKSTAWLMVEFHQNLASGLSPAEALQHAQLTVRRDPRLSHPFYWAPFVVIGHGFAPLVPR
jgi:CHAT domain-containing protein